MAKAGEPLHDATIVPVVQPSKVTAAADHRGFTAHVTAVSAAYGNVTIDAQPADLVAAGISPETWFELSAHGKSYPTFYGSDFGSVKVGEWVLFPDADGFFTVSKNFADAAGSAGLKEGDEVTVRRTLKATH
jgi:S-adenosylmethionine hydrolase